MVLRSTSNGRLSEAYAEGACAQDRPASAPASPQVHQRPLPVGSAWPSAGARTAPYNGVVRSFPRGLAGYQRRGLGQDRKDSGGSRASGKAGVAVRRMNSAPETPSRLLLGRKSKPAVRLTGALGHRILWQHVR